MQVHESTQGRRAPAPYNRYAGLELFEEQLTDNELKDAAHTLDVLKAQAPNEFVTAAEVRLAARQEDKAKALEAGAAALSGQLGRTVQRLRKTYNLSLSDLSTQSGVAKSIISQIERNETNPTLATLWRLAHALDVSIESMLQGGQEVIVGAVTDGSFGKLVAFGMGGVLVEVLKDITFRLAPATRAAEPASAAHRPSRSRRRRANRTQAASLRCAGRPRS